MAHRHSEPDLFGGYNHYDEHGRKVGHSDPDLLGGFRDYDSHDPDLFGGYDHYDRDGIRIGHTDPDLFGGLNHYDEDGTLVGHSDPDLLSSYSHPDSQSSIMRSTTSGSTGSSARSSQGCYIATCVYGSYDCPQVWTLRRFRDERLARSGAGRLFIRGYYAISPAVVRRFGQGTFFSRFLRPVLDRMVRSLRHRGYPDTPYKDPTPAEQQRTAGSL